MADFFVDKSEAEWEEYLRWSDKYSERCFTLLRRFIDMPDGDELINQKLEEEFGRLEVFEAMPSWDYAAELNRYDSESQTDLDDREDMPGDELPYADWADTPAKQRLFAQVSEMARIVLDGINQAIFDWCNIQAILVPKRFGGQGMAALFHLSRAMSYLNLGMEGLTVQRSFSTVAAFKRGLADVNAVVRIFEKLSQGWPAAENNFGTQDLIRKRAEQLYSVVENFSELALFSRKIVNRRFS